jgi:hypothetical protein
MVCYPELNVLGGGHALTLCQTAGLSTSLPDQVRQILEVVGTALHSISSSRNKQARHDSESAVQSEGQVQAAERVRELIRRGIWHDPRMGPIAGGGVIAELGVGDEPFNGRDEDFVSNSLKTEVPTAKRGGYDPSGPKAVNTLPIVVLKNYYTATGKEEVTAVFARWAAALVEEQVRPPASFVGLWK